MLYEYKCETCSRTDDFEYELAEEKPKRKMCPNCGTMTMHRLFGSALHVPFQWTGDSYRFDKRDRKNRKYR